jgi:uncharacterized protein YjbJ (UPF0337 family)
MAGQDDQAAGKAKELIGKVTGDDSMKSEGKVQHAGGKVKEGAHDAADSVKGAAKGVQQAVSRNGDRDRR